jgi:hypothetical protein
MYSWHLRLEPNPARNPLTVVKFLQNRVRISGLVVRRGFPIPQHIKDGRLPQGESGAPATAVLVWLAAPKWVGGTPGGHLSVTRPMRRRDLDRRGGALDVTRMSGR